MEQSSARKPPLNHRYMPLLEMRRSPSPSPAAAFPRRFRGPRITGALCNLGFTLVAALL